MKKQFDHQEAQQLLRAQWAQEKTYTQQNTTDPLYSIDTPPPTVSGTLHIGHIFSYTQTDIIARYKRMSGFTVFYPFGFDDNGLPTERYIEKKTGLLAHQIGRSAFSATCLKETAVVEEAFKDLWQQMGISAYWDNTYATIAPDVRKISQQSFLALLQKNEVYRQYEPAIYCTSCRTSVAQADLDDAQVASSFNTIIFEAPQQEQLFIGTTRPELLPSCVALLFHPSDGRYTHLHNQFATTPLFGNKVPILADELVNPQKGTGLVMVCTFGDTTDVIWYKKYNLPYIQSIGADGKMLPNTSFLAGLNVLQARTTILEKLKEGELLTAQQPITHTVSIHERCKKGVEYLMLAQWFVRILPHKQQLIELADQINWFPTFMKTRYINWVENLGWDWGISRQRYFGIPFPVWHCNNCKAIITPTQEQLPLDPQETAPTQPCSKCGSTDITADTDVMDTWNTSSLTPYICAALYNPQENVNFFTQSKVPFLPMALRPQAHDIIRTWAFYTIVKTYLHHQTIPWKDIVISGHVLSNQKEKISKSQGNSILEPTQLIAQYSVDAIRYWTASTTLGHDTAFSIDQLKLGQRLVTKLWNAFLFAQPHITHVTLKENLTLGRVNEWILHQLKVVEEKYHTSFENEYEFGAALSALEQFFWQDYCDNYIELIKHQLFNPQLYEPERVEATQQTLYTVGLKLLQLFAPYLPYVTDTIYQELYKNIHQSPSVHQTRFDSQNHHYAQSAQETNILLQLVSNVRKLKTEQQLSLKTEIEELIIITSNTRAQEVITQEKIMLQGVTQAKSINFSTKEFPTEIYNKNDSWYMHINLES